MSNSHDEVDGVEVSGAAEAAREICFWVYGGVELIAEWAEESQESVAVLRRECERALDKLSDRDVIPQ